MKVSGPLNLPVVFTACLALVGLTSCSAQVGRLDSAPTPPEPMDFTAQAAQMATWDDPCEVVDLEPLTDEFGPDVFAEPEHEDPEEGSDPNTTWTGRCMVQVVSGMAATFVQFFLRVDAFDTNTQAFEYYYSDTVEAPNQLHPHYEIESSIDVGDDTSWSAARVTVQQGHAVNWGPRVMEFALLLGDFYTVQLQVMFIVDPELRTDCDPSGSRDCAMTEERMTDYLTSGDLLESMHDDIEAAIQPGGD